MQKKRHDGINILFGVGLTIMAVFCCIPVTASMLHVDINTTLPMSFSDIQPKTPLTGTNYEIDYTDHNLVVKSTLNGATLPIIRRYSPIAAPPAYHLLNTPSYDFLIVRLDSGGNSGALWFKVFNLNAASPVDLTAQSSEPNIGLSCTYPVFDGATLKFEISADCRANPLSQSAGYRSYFFPLPVLH